MHVLLAAMILLIVSGLLAFVAGRSPRLSTALGAGGAAAGCALGLIPAVGVVIGGTTEAIHRAWDVPYGSFSVALDPLSAWFVVPILGLSGLAAIYGAKYLEAYGGRKSLGAPWFFFNVLVASMVLVVLARNGVLFLVAWEVMSLASYFLVTFDDEDEEVREAGRTYLVATHLGTAFLLAFFVLLAGSAGSLDFAAIAAQATPASGGVLFLLAVVGFGTKAGFMPLHVWLPEAHPAAPSHVSAVMSGRDGQGRDLRPGPRADLSSRRTRMVGLAADRHRNRVRDLGCPLRVGPARPQAPAGVLNGGEHRHHRAWGSESGCWGLVTGSLSLPFWASRVRCCTSSTTPCSRVCFSWGRVWSCTRPARGTSTCWAACRSACPGLPAPSSSAPSRLPVCRP